MFKQTETRGEDASGFWGTTKNDIVFYKQPIKSSEMVKKSVWSNLKDKKTDMLLTHCRAATPGLGKPKENINNHPFVSNNNLVGLIHNGNISEEYNNLKYKFNLESECDSEILLRLYESAAWDYSPTFENIISQFGVHIAKRIAGIRNIWRQIKKGHMAVAIGEKLEQQRCLWLFRNEHRSLWLVDMRDELGQIFFCSTPEIWDEAGFPNKTLIELPPDEVWLFLYPSDTPLDDEHLHRFVLANYKNELILCENDESAFDDMPPQEIYHSATDNERELLNFNCKCIADLALDINTIASNDDGNICNFEDLISNVDDVKRDLENIMRLLNNGYY